jgi:hypothetical protein
MRETLITSEVRAMIGQETPPERNRTRKYDRS